MLIPGFLLLNVVAFNHAWRFTHFSDPAKTRTADPESLGFWDKLATLIIGIDNPRPTNTLPAEAYETWHIPSRNDMKMEAWWMSLQSAKGIVLLFPGYAGQKSSLLGQAQAFRGLGYHTVLVDFLGHGGSEGNFTSLGYGEADDIAFAVKHVHAHYPALPIYLYGFSMGASAIIRSLAIHDLPVEKAIVGAPFASMLKTVKNRFALMGVPATPFAELLVFWGGVQHGFWAFEYNPLAYAPDIDTPVLILQGGLDQRARLEDVRRLYERLAGPKEMKVFEQLAHKSYLNKHAEGWKAIVRSWLED